MKISDDISRGSFLWQIRIIRAFSILFLMVAIINQRYFVDFIAFSIISLFASFMLSRRESNLRLEVYDCKEFLRLKLDHKEITIAFSKIEKMEIRDGKDGLDWIIVYFKFNSEFGRVIQFYPNVANISMSRLEIWIAEMNERIYKSRICSNC